MSKFRLFYRKLDLPNFIREVLVVMIGVFATFAITDSIDSSKRASEIEETLSLVRDELRSNRDIADSILSTLRKNERAYKFLYANRDNIKNINPDTLLYYMRLTTVVRRSTMDFYAKDVLKSSSHYRELNNNLLIYLNSVYGKNEVYRNEMGKYFKTTGDIFDQSTLILYKNRSPKPVEIYAALSDIGLFRARLYNKSLISIVIEDSRGISYELNKCANILDSLIQNKCYADFKPVKIDR